MANRSSTWVVLACALLAALQACSDEKTLSPDSIPGLQRGCIRVQASVDEPTIIDGRTEWLPGGFATNVLLSLPFIDVSGLEPPYFDGTNLAPAEECAEAVVTSLIEGDKDLFLRSTRFISGNNKDDVRIDPSVVDYFWEGYGGKLESAELKRLFFLSDLIGFQFLVTGLSDQPTLETFYVAYSNNETFHFIGDFDDITDLVEACLTPWDKSNLDFIEDDNERRFSVFLQDTLVEGEGIFLLFDGTYPNEESRLSYAFASLNEAQEALVQILDDEPAANESFSRFFGKLDTHEVNDLIPRNPVSGDKVDPDALSESDMAYVVRRLSGIGDVFLGTPQLAIPCTSDLTLLLISYEYANEKKLSYLWLHGPPEDARFTNLSLSNTWKRFFEDEEIQHRFAQLLKTTE